MTVSKVKDPNKLGFGRLMAFKSSDISAGWVNLIVLNYLSIYASDTLGVNIGTVGTLLLASKILDAITDILAGWLVDNTNSKLGKGRPYELAIIGMTITTIFLFSASPEWSNFAKCAWIFSMYTLTFSIFYTLRNAATSAYTIRIFSNNPVLLRKVASYGGIITMGATMALSIAFPMLMQSFATSSAGWTRLILIIMVPATLIALPRFFLCKEDPAVDEAAKQQERVSLKTIKTLLTRNKYVWIYAAIMLCYNIMTNLAVGSYFFKWVVGNIALQGVVSIFSIVLLPLMFVFPFIMKKIGSMGKMLTYFCVISIIGYVIVFFAGANLPGIMIGSLLGAIAGLPIAYYGVLFIMNICTYNEMIGLPRMDGASSSLANFMTKFGAALGSWVTGLLLMFAGYVSAEGVATQPDSALMMIRVDFALVPAAMLLIIAVCALAFSRLEPKVEAFEAQKRTVQNSEQPEATV